MQARCEELARGFLKNSSARDLQAFLLFFQHLAWGYHAGKPMESVFYCFYKITLSKTVIGF